MDVYETMKPGTSNPIFVCSEANPTILDANVTEEAAVVRDQADKWYDNRLQVHLSEKNRLDNLRFKKRSQGN